MPTITKTGYGADEQPIANAHVHFAAPFKLGDQKMVLLGQQYAATAASDEPD